jgi:hypothetical protein
MHNKIGLTKYSSQYIHNLSFDDDFKVQVFETVAYDPITDTVKRVTMDALNHYATNDVDTPDSDTVYEGLEDSDGGWQIVKTVKDGNQNHMRFATVKNNITYTSYADAWTARTLLDYGYYSVAF